MFFTSGKRSPLPPFDKQLSKFNDAKRFIGLLDLCDFTSQHKVNKLRSVWGNLYTGRVEEKKRSSLPIPEEYDDVLDKKKHLVG